VFYKYKTSRQTINLAN